MHYHAVQSAIFLSRPNRFIARVQMGDKEEICHVKNTGRCRELLVPGCTVYLEKAENPARKTAYDLIAVQKGHRIINMDAQAPNHVFAEWVTEGGFCPDVRKIHPEYRYGRSRLDFFLDTVSGPHLVEVKGVTLESEGHAYFPDAPTERGVRHIRELQRAAEEGWSATLFFVVQMEHIESLSPNDITQPEFGAALRDAEHAGVRIEAWECAVTMDSLKISSRVPVILKTGVSTI
jgi:sugar fermentation stimulation protein A